MTAGPGTVWGVMFAGNVGLKRALGKSGRVLEMFGSARRSAGGVSSDNQLLVKNRHNSYGKSGGGCLRRATRWFGMDGAMVQFDNYLDQLGLSKAEASRLSPSERSRKLAHAQFLKAAFDELVSSNTAVTPIDAVQALTWLRKSGELQKADSFFISLSGKLKNDPRVLLEYIFLLVAAGRFQDAQKALQFFLDREYEQYTSFEKLLALAPFATDGSLRDLAARVILGHRTLSNPSWFHFLFELTTRRGLIESASTLLEVYRGSVTKEGKTNEDLCFDSNLAFRRADFAEQNRKLSEVFAAYGLSQTKLKDPGKPFSVLNLESDAPAAIRAETPLVTVLIATFNTEATIGAVCRSLLAQTYGNLELVVVDDASTDLTREIVREFTETDKRVRLLTLEENQGTYTAFNHGLRAAKGEFVTCQGADDWAHPEKISTLVSALQENPDAVATKTRKVRCAESDGLESSPTGYITRDISSLTYRREVVTRELGYYDTVRCSGDTEFLQRLRYRFGTNSILNLPAVTGVCDWSSNGLTGGQRFAVQGPFASPARTEYRRCFRTWHEKARLCGDLHIPFPQNGRKFPAPDEVLPKALTP